ncbi:MAG TPA: TetR family transcriptional regulator [Acidimicrobiales bacterium]|nr:TetR family transcriptional regulator [Acidimicrobiales bacterium]
MGRIAGVTAEETRRRLLDAAAAEFDRRGFEGARVADIAAGADLSNGAMYRHFRGKSDLLSAALTDRGARELEDLFAGSDGRSIADLLAAIGRSLDRMPTGRGGLMVEALVAARRDPEVAEVSGRHLAGTEEWLGGLIRDGQAEGVIDPSVDSRSLARFCVMLVLGATLMAPADLPSGSKEGWADLIERIAGSLGAARG